MVSRCIFNEFSRGFPELANPWLTKYWKQNIFIVRTVGHARFSFFIFLLFVLNKTFCLLYPSGCDTFFLLQPYIQQSNHATEAFGCFILREIKQVIFNLIRKLPLRTIEGKVRCIVFCMVGIPSICKRNSGGRGKTKVLKSLFTKSKVYQYNTTQANQPNER